MSSKTFLKFTHKIDIYSKSESINAAGQKTLSFTKVATVPALFQSNSSERRIYPYVANIDEYQFYIPYMYNDYITYSARISNIVDRKDNIIENGPLEIVNIEKKTGFGGRLHHIFINTRRVVENG